MAIETVSQSVTVSEVGDVVVTDIQQDGGVYVREVRVFGIPKTEGGNVPLVFVLRVEGETRNTIEFTAPSANY